MVPLLHNIPYLPDEDEDEFPDPEEAQEEQETEEEEVQEQPQTLPISADQPCVLDHTDDVCESIDVKDVPQEGLFASDDRVTPMGDGHSNGAECNSRQEVEDGPQVERLSSHTGIPSEVSVHPISNEFSGVEPSPITEDNDHHPHSVRMEPERDPNDVKEKNEEDGEGAEEDKGLGSHDDQEVDVEQVEETSQSAGAAAAVAAPDVGMNSVDSDDHPEVKKPVVEVMGLDSTPAKISLHPESHSLLPSEAAVDQDPVIDGSTHDTAPSSSIPWTTPRDGSVPGVEDDEADADVGASDADANVDSPLDTTLPLHATALPMSSGAPEASELIVVPPLPATADVFDVVDVPQARTPTVDSQCSPALSGRSSSPRQAADAPHARDPPSSSSPRLTPLPSPVELVTPVMVNVPEVLCGGAGDEVEPPADSSATAQGDVGQGMEMEGSPSAPSAPEGDLRDNALLPCSCSSPGDAVLPVDVETDAEDGVIRPAAEETNVSPPPPPAAAAAEASPAAVDDVESTGAKENEVGETASVAPWSDETEPSPHLAVPHLEEGDHSAAGAIRSTSAMEHKEEEEEEEKEKAIAAPETPIQTLKDTTTSLEQEICHTRPAEEEEKEKEPQLPDSDPQPSPSPRLTGRTMHTSSLVSVNTLQTRLTLVPTVDNTTSSMAEDVGHLDGVTRVGGHDAPDHREGFSDAATTLSSPLPSSRQGIPTPAADPPPTEMKKEEEEEEAKEEAVPTTEGSDSHPKDGSRHPIIMKTGMDEKEEEEEAEANARTTPGPHLSAPGAGGTALEAMMMMEEAAVEPPSLFSLSQDRIDEAAALQESGDTHHTQIGAPHAARSSHHHQDDGDHKDQMVNQSNNEEEEEEHEEHQQVGGLDVTERSEAVIPDSGEEPLGVASSMEDLSHSPPLSHASPSATAVSGGNSLLGGSGGGEGTPGLQEPSVARTTIGGGAATGTTRTTTTSWTTPSLPSAASSHTLTDAEKDCALQIYLDVGGIRKDNLAEVLLHYFHISTPLPLDVYPYFRPDYHPPSSPHTQPHPLQDQQGMVENGEIVMTDERAAEAEAEAVVSPHIEPSPQPQEPTVASGATNTMTSQPSPSMAPPTGKPPRPFSPSPLPTSRSGVPVDVTATPNYLMQPLPWLDLLAELGSAVQWHVAARVTSPPAPLAASAAMVLGVLEEEEEVSNDNTRNKTKITLDSENPSPSLPPQRLESEEGEAEGRLTDSNAPPIAAALAGLVGFLAEGEDGEEEEGAVGRMGADHGGERQTKGEAPICGGEEEVEEEEEDPDTPPSGLVVVPVHHQPSASSDDSWQAEEGGGGGIVGERPPPPHAPLSSAMPCDPVDAVPIVVPLSVESVNHDDTVVSGSCPPLGEDVTATTTLTATLSPRNPADASGSPAALPPHSTTTALPPSGNDEMGEEEEGDDRGPGQMDVEEKTAAAQKEEEEDEEEEEEEEKVERPSSIASIISNPMNYYEVLRDERSDSSSALQAAAPRAATVMPRHPGASLSGHSDLGLDDEGHVSSSPHSSPTRNSESRPSLADLLRRRSDQMETAVNTMAAAVAVRSGQREVVPLVPPTTASSVAGLPDSREDSRQSASPDRKTAMAMSAHELAMMAAVREQLKSVQQQQQQTLEQQQQQLQLQQQLQEMSGMSPTPVSNEDVARALLTSLFVQLGATEHRRLDCDEDEDEDEDEDDDEDDPQRRMMATTIWKLQKHPLGDTTNSSPHHHQHHQQPHGGSSPQTGTVEEGVISPRRTKKDAVLGLTVRDLEMALSLLAKERGVPYGDEGNDVSHRKHRNSQKWRSGSAASSSYSYSSSIGSGSYSAGGSSVRSAKRGMNKGKNKRRGNNNNNNNSTSQPHSAEGQKNLSSPHFITSPSDVQNGNHDGNKNNNSNRNPRNVSASSRSKMPLPPKPFIASISHLIDTIGKSSCNTFSHPEVTALKAETAGLVTDPNLSSGTGSKTNGNGSGGNENNNNNNNSNSYDKQENRNSHLNHDNIMGDEIGLPVASPALPYIDVTTTMASIQRRPDMAVLAAAGGGRYYDASGDWIGPEPYLDWYQFRTVVMDELDSVQRCLQRMHEAQQRVGGKGKKGRPQRIIPVPLIFPTRPPVWCLTLVGVAPVDMAHFCGTEITRYLRSVEVIKRAVRFLLQERTRALEEERQRREAEEARENAVSINERRRREALRFGEQYAKVKSRYRDPPKLNEIELSIIARAKARRLLDKLRRRTVPVNRKEIYVRASIEAKPMHHSVLREALDVALRPLHSAQRGEADVSGSGSARGGRPTSKTRSTAPRVTHPLCRSRSGSARSTPRSSAGGYSSEEEGTPTHEGNVRDMKKKKKNRIKPNGRRESHEVADDILYGSGGKTEKGKPQRRGRKLVLIQPYSSSAQQSAAVRRLSTPQCDPKWYQILCQKQQSQQQPSLSSTASSPTAAAAAALSDAARNIQLRKEQLAQQHQKRQVPRQDDEGQQRSSTRTSASLPPALRPPSTRSSASSPLLPSSPGGVSSTIASSSYPHLDHGGLSPKVPEQGKSTHKKKSHKKGESGTTLYKEGECKSPGAPHLGAAVMTAAAVAAANAVHGYGNSVGTHNNNSSSASQAVPPVTKPSSLVSSSVAGELPPRHDGRPPSSRPPSSIKSSSTPHSHHGKKNASPVPSNHNDNGRSPPPPLAPRADRPPSSPPPPPPPPPTTSSPHRHNHHHIRVHRRERGSRLNSACTVSSFSRSRSSMNSSASASSSVPSVHPHYHVAEKQEEAEADEETATTTTTTATSSTSLDNERKGVDNDAVHSPHAAVPGVSSPPPVKHNSSTASLPPRHPGPAGGAASSGSSPPSHHRSGSGRAHRHVRPASTNRAVVVDTRHRSRRPASTSATLGSSAGRGRGPQKEDERERMREAEDHQAGGAPDVSMETDPTMVQATPNPHDHPYGGGTASLTSSISVLRMPSVSSISHLSSANTSARGAAAGLPSHASLPPAPQHRSSLNEEAAAQLSAELREASARRRRQQDMQDARPPSHHGQEHSRSRSNLSGGSPGKHGKGQYAVPSEEPNTNTKQRRVSHSRSRSSSSSRRRRERKDGGLQEIEKKLERRRSAECEANEEAAEKLHQQRLQRPPLKELVKNHNSNDVPPRGPEKRPSSTNVSISRPASSVSSVAAAAAVSASSLVSSTLYHPYATATSTGSNTNSLAGSSAPGVSQRRQKLNGALKSPPSPSQSSLHGKTDEEVLGDCGGAGHALPFRVYRTIDDPAAVEACHKAALSESRQLEVEEEIRRRKEQRQRPPPPGVRGSSANPAAWDGPALRTPYEDEREHTILLRRLLGETADALLRQSFQGTSMSRGDGAGNSSTAATNGSGSGRKTKKPEWDCNPYAQPLPKREVPMLPPARPQRAKDAGTSSRKPILSPATRGVGVKRTNSAVHRAGPPPPPPPPRRRTTTQSRAISSSKSAGRRATKSEKNSKRRTSRRRGTPPPGKELVHPHGSTSPHSRHRDSPSHPHRETKHEEEAEDSHYRHHHRYDTHSAEGNDYVQDNDNTNHRGADHHHRHHHVRYHEQHLSSAHTRGRDALEEEEEKTPERYVGTGREVEQEGIPPSQAHDGRHRRRRVKDDHYYDRHHRQQQQTLSPVTSSSSSTAVDEDGSTLSTASVVEATDVPTAAMLNHSGDGGNRRREVGGVAAVLCSLSTLATADVSRSHSSPEDVAARAARPTAEPARDSTAQRSSGGSGSVAEDPFFAQFHHQPSAAVTTQVRAGRTDEMEVGEEEAEEVFRPSTVLGDDQVVPVPASPPSYPTQAEADTDDERKRRRAEEEPEGERPSFHACLSTDSERLSHSSHGEAAGVGTNDQEADHNGETCLEANPEERFLHAMTRHMHQPQHGDDDEEEECHPEERERRGSLPPSAAVAAAPFYIQEEEEEEEEEKNRQPPVSLAPPPAPPAPTQEEEDVEEDPQEDCYSSSPPQSYHGCGGDLTPAHSMPLAGAMSPNRPPAYPRPVAAPHLNHYTTPNNTNDSYNNNNNNNNNGGGGGGAHPPLPMQPAVQLPSSPSFTPVASHGILATVGSVSTVMHGTTTSAASSTTSSAGLLGMSQPPPSQRAPTLCRAQARPGSATAFQVAAAAAGTSGNPLANSLGSNNGSARRARLQLSPQKSE